MSDEELARSVRDELLWDPKIDAAGIAMAADDGIVTLRGTVGSFHQKRAAAQAAERVRGVVSVRNRIDVEILTPDRREDADLRGDVLEALMLDALVPTSVDARVADGWVTLTGEVDWQYQRDEAEQVAGHVPGVTDVVDQILLSRSPGDVADDVGHTIKKAFLRNARLDAEHLDVAVSDGTITLTGPVHSREERDAAVAAAWSAPGVRDVDDRLTAHF